MGEHEMNQSCAIRFTHIDDETREIIRRVERLEKDINGNGKTGLKQDVSEVKRDIEDVCKSNDRIETQLKEFIDEYREVQKAVSEGDKNRKNEISKILTTNGFQLVQAVVGALIIYFLWRLTGQIP